VWVWASVGTDVGKFEAGVDGGVGVLVLCVCMLPCL